MGSERATATLFQRPGSDEIHPEGLSKCCSALPLADFLVQEHSVRFSSTLASAQLSYSIPIPFHPYPFPSLSSCLTSPGLDGRSWALLPEPVTRSASSGGRPATRMQTWEDLECDIHRSVFSLCMHSGCFSLTARGRKSENAVEFHLSM